MTQVFVTDESTGEVIVRSDLRVPADAAGSQLQVTVVQVDNFLTNPTPITFVLDERFREKALRELFDRSSFPSAEVLVRDNANALVVNVTKNDSSTPGFVTVPMKHRLYDAESVNKLINRRFTEFTS